MTNEELFKLQMSAEYHEEDSRAAICRLHWKEDGESHMYVNLVNLTVARILKRELQKRNLNTWIEVE